jgi:hypothetical protein
VPRAKYTKPPGPLRAIEQIQHSKFRFRNDQWRKLAKLLPCKLPDLGVPSDYAATVPKKVKTLADLVIHETEEAIYSYLTASPLISEVPVNPANVQAAIRQLREALKPFVRGWVDDETADIIPAELDTKLAARNQEIAKLHLPPAERRLLAKLCQDIAAFVRQFSSANGEKVSEQNILRFVDTALNFARIEHPNTAKHRDRLAALVFPKD